MAFQPVNNTAKFTAFFTADGEPCQFAVYCQNDAAPWDAAQLQLIGDGIRDAIVASYVPLLSTDHAYVGIEGRDLEVQYGRVETIMEAAPVAGTLASPTLPNHVSVVGRFASATGAPRRGRINLLPPSESQVEGSSLTGAAQAALQGALEAIHNAVDAGAGPAHVIVSRFSGTTPVEHEGKVVARIPNPRAGAAIVATVASVSVQARLGSQRRRRPRAA